MTSAAAPALDGASKEDEALSVLDEDPRTHSPLPMREIVIHHSSGENGSHGIAVDDDTANETEPFGSDAYMVQVVMECFGLLLCADETETLGTYTCLRHPEGGPIVTGLASQLPSTFQLSPCAQCYQDERLQPFAASPPSQWTLYQLVHFLQTSSSGNHNVHTIDTLFQAVPNVTPSSNDTEDSSTEGKVESSPEQSLSARILAAMSTPQGTRCTLQRLAQVQHWHRQTEYQQRQQYQQLVLSLQQQNLQHQATIKQLRRTIQQDCKFIKTMATQQQDVEQAILGLSNHGSNSVDVTPPPQPPQGSPPKAVVTRSRSSISQSLHHVASAHVIHESLGEEEETTETTAADDDFLQSPPVTENNTPNPSLLPSWNNALPQRRSLRSSSSSEMIFRSFRGGLLDPPSSPPVPFKKAGGHKLTLDSDARHALQIPSRGLLSRSNSVAGDVPPEANKGGLPNAPFSPMATAESVATPGTTDDDDEEEDDAAPTTTTAAGGATVFHVTGAASRDKFGDAGLYTGPILVTEGLPHGSNGRMEYRDSGRIYEGDWIAGQWHGRGRLLNPNGDSYEGDFCFDARHGQGVYRWDNGDVYVGNFTSDKRHGQGKFCFHNGNVYEGEFLDGLFDGYGKYVFAGGSYEGNWKDGRYNGNGVLTYSATGGKYTGEFRNSVAHGFGIEILPDGRQRRGMWVDGKPTEFSEDAKPPVPASAAAEEEDPK